MAKKLWIGLAGALQPAGVTIFDECAGGYAKVVAAANGQLSFERKVCRALAEIGLELFELVDVEVLPVHVLRTEHGDEVFEMAETVRGLDSVAFGTFHTFDSFNDEEDEPEIVSKNKPVLREN